MNALQKLKEVLEDNRRVRLIEDGIYSVLPDAFVFHHYDKRAAIYDRVVGTRVYNAIMWGNSPLDYVAFARQAVVSRADGKLLDAGCGSLLFTAPAYVESDRQIIAFDQSLAMLRRARRRLMDLTGSRPEHILLLQADLSDLPFRPSVFHTVLCLNVLHQFKRAADLVSNLKRVLTGDGLMYLTSLVSNNRLIGDHYLNALHATGEFVQPRSSVELQELLNSSLSQKVSYVTRGNMAYMKTATPLPDQVK